MSRAHGALGIILAAGEYERAQYALMMATAAASIGRHVVLFVTNAGINALRRRTPDGEPGWTHLSGSVRDVDLQGRGIAGMADLLLAAVELGIRIMVCETGLKAEGLTASDLSPAIAGEVTGLVSFYEAVGDGAIVFI